MQWSEEEKLEPESLSCCHISSIIHSFNKHSLSTAMLQNLIKPSVLGRLCSDGETHGNKYNKPRGNGRLLCLVQRVSRADLKPGVVSVHSPCQPSASLSVSSHSSL